jgi:hypothetical protein
VSFRWDIRPELRGVDVATVQVRLHLDDGSDHTVNFVVQ